MTSAAGRVPGAVQSGSPAGIQRPATEGTALRWALLALALLLIVLCDSLHGTHANVSF